MRAALGWIILAAAVASQGGTAMPGKGPLLVESCIGKPVDIAPWAYAWRADMRTQQHPEAYFIPRRLDRIDRVYRTAREALSPDQLKSIHYNQQDILTPLPPKPIGELTAALLWIGGLNGYTVTVTWPTNRPVPSVDAVEVRTYPTAFGWFGWTVDRIMGPPAVSKDGHVWTYHSDPSDQMDSSYNARIPAATEMVAVFTHTLESLTVPDIAVTGPDLGHWRRYDLQIDWLPGAPAGTRKINGHVAVIGPVQRAATDTQTAVQGHHTWRLMASGIRSVTVAVAGASGNRPGHDSRITIWHGQKGVTIRLSDVLKGPVYVPAHHLLVRVTGDSRSAQACVDQIRAAGRLSLRDRTQQHREASSWDELMREVRLWTCPLDTPVPPFSDTPPPAMRVDLSDRRWSDAWRTAVHQLRGQHMWGGLAFEVARVTRAMEMIGLRTEADTVYDHFLKSPGAKADGDFSDGDGAFEWATSMRHDIGYNHDGTHASTGRMLLSMSERYFLAGDTGWFREHLPRLKQAADWIIRQRTTYMSHIPNRSKLFVAGLMPPYMLGDYALPACDWHWYYVDNALSLQGLQRFADALSEVDPQAGRAYQREAAAFRRDLLRVVEQEAALAPVRRGEDGTYRMYLPRMAYARGLTGPELGAPQFPDTDKFMGALPLGEPFGAMPANDRRMLDTLDLMEEMGVSEQLVAEAAPRRAASGLSAADTWFWTPFVILPKASHNANLFLLQDDVPNFLRFFFNAYATMTGSDGRLWEHWHLGGYDPCEAPDNGTAGWFCENMRNMLVMEEGKTLWLARATPRAWLESGRTIHVADAPSYFGTVAYSITSQLSEGAIRAEVDSPDRKRPGQILLRLRHPNAAPIRSVSVNGQPWKRFDAQRETVILPAPKGKLVVEARY